MHRWAFPIVVLSAAITLEVEGLSLKVASLDDLMRMKEASGLPKDRIELEVLGALKDELEP